MKLDREQLGLAAFLAGSVLAGGNAVGVRFSNRELERLWGAGVRFVLAAALLTAVLSAWLDDEPLTAALAVGGAFALAGVYLCALRAPAPDS